MLDRIRKEGEQQQAQLEQPYAGAAAYAAAEAVAENSYNEQCSIADHEVDIEAKDKPHHDNKDDAANSDREDDTSPHVTAENNPSMSFRKGFLGSFLKVSRHRGTTTDEAPGEEVPTSASTFKFSFRRRSHSKDLLPEQLAARSRIESKERLGSVLDWVTGTASPAKALVPVAV